ncbi:MAG: ATP-binding protein [Verrucomicrobiota bacterium]|jgi:signal transduction histidine kinase
MNQGIKFRLAIFITSIGLLVVLIGWTAHSSWERISGSHEKLSELQWQSFQSADHLQQTLLSLNNSILRYAAYRDPDDWTNFASASQDLQHWLNAQVPILSSETDRSLLDQINAAYVDYDAAAAAIHTRIYGTHQAITRVAELADFETQSKRILDLGFQLAKAHQDSLEEFRQQNLRSLDVLRMTLFGALALLVIAGVCLAVIVYREMISPLQVQLVESRQLAERQEKLASLGMLAAGVAHEIRNPLTAIKAWLYLQQKHLTPDTPEYADAELIGGEINRLERIVRDFLQFARPSEPQFNVVPADQPLRQVQTLLQPEFEKANIQIMLAEIVPAQIRIDPEQIKQVLINLIRNAAESIGENGTVTLRVRLGEKRLADRHQDVVILEVSDTGKGIPPEAEKRLFDPFFTTKDYGTGLGLPIAARIVEKHHGALQYQTQPDRGTTFGIILPRIPS